MFKKYIHLERFGTDAVDGINIGKCYIFPKIDGTNACFWYDSEDQKFHCGSRNRELALGDDNAGFMCWAVAQERLLNLAKAYPNHVFYGEWLVPHSLKTYRDDAWKKLYIFDVVDPEGNFLHYDKYSKMLEAFEVVYIPCTLVATNPTYEQLLEATSKNTYLISEGAGFGEGVVIKRYDYTNKFGHTIWAKLITNTFKEKHVLAMGGAVTSTKLVEEEIVDVFMTKHVVDKIMAKIRNDQGSFGSRNIPQLLNTAFHELVSEELWEALKKFKNPKIDFKTLNHCSNSKVKALLPEIFGMPASA